jgi:spore germination protein YaaH
MLAPMTAVVAAAALVAAVAVVAGGGGHRKPGPPPKVFAFVSGLGGAEIARLEQIGSRIDVIAPNWYTIDVGSGELTTPLRGDADALLAAARERRVRVWPTVNALTGTSRAWESPVVRARIAASLRAASLSPGVSGVTLDMEELRPYQRATFSALVREAATDLHAVHRKLAVYVPRPGPVAGAAYDWRGLSRHADLLLASGYNEHWAGGRPGPVTTSRGFGDVVDRAITAAGRRKAVPVLGAFGYRWPASGRGQMISTVDAENVRRGGRFDTGGETVVYNTTAELRAGARAARAAGARWIGLFSLGREPERFWRRLETARTHARAAAQAR